MSPATIISFTLSQHLAESYISLDLRTKTQLNSYRSALVFDECNDVLFSLYGDQNVRWYSNHSPLVRV